MRHRARAFGGIRFVDENSLTFSNSYTIVGAVMGGAGWYLYRLARGPEGGCFNTWGRVRLFGGRKCLTWPFRVFAIIVVWTRTNPNPRNTIEQDQNIKMLAVSHKFDGGRFVTPHACVPSSHGSL